MSVQNNIVNTTFRWTGLDGGGTAFGRIAAVATTAAGAAAYLGRQLWQLADRTTQIYGRFYDLSERTGIAASQLHAMSIAAEQDGVALDDVLTGLRRLPSAIDDLARGSETAQRSFAMLGLTMDDLAGLSLEEQFYRVGGALANVQDESTRAALAADVFGRSGMNLLPFLERGERGLRELTEAARASGQVLGEDAYAAADRFGDALVEMRNRFNSLLMEGLEPILPELEGLGDTLVELADAAMPALAAATTTILIPALQTLTSILTTAAEGWEYYLALFDESALAKLTEIEGGPVAQYGYTMSEIRAIHDQRVSESGSVAAWMDENAATTAGTNAGSAYTAGLSSGLSSNAPAVVETAEKDIWTPLKEAARAEAEHEMELARIAAEKRATIMQYEHDQLEAAEQAEYEARLERLQTFADISADLFSRSWDIMFGNARQGFDDMLRDMLMELAKSGLLKLLRGAITGGVGFLL